MKYLATTSRLRNIYLKYEIYIQREYIYLIYAYNVHKC